MFHLESSWKGFGELMAHRERSGNTLLLLTLTNVQGCLYEGSLPSYKWEVGDKKCKVVGGH